MEEFREKVEKIFDKIRPYLRDDDGDVEFVDFNPQNGVMLVRMTGNCKTCPLAIMTLRAGIERLVKKEMPEVTRLEQVS